MRLGTVMKTGAALAALFVLAACGNNQQDGTALIRSLPSKIFSKPEPPAIVTAEQAAASLQATPNPVWLVDAETRKTQFLAVEIQRNGDYRTFASATRQTVVIRDGLVTATRGFGGDLMSAEVGALLAQVSARRPGTVTYVQRFLTADDQTVTRSYACTVSPGQSAPSPLGGTAQAVVVSCSGDGAEFRDGYLVEASGRIVGGRQWLGDLIGVVNTQPIRY